MSITPLGNTCIVLHGHLPWVHHPGHEEFLEEDWFLEAVLETYLPLLSVLERLGAERVPVRLALGLTPPLLEMLRAPVLLRKAARFLERRRELAEMEVARVADQPLMHATARHYAERFRELCGLWKRAGGDLPGAFRSHMEQGRLELLASAATHPVLPLVLTPAMRRVQVRLGLALFREVFGTEPAGFWLPECAYTPGLDTLLQEEGLRWVVLESHGVRGARPAPSQGVHRPLRLPSGLTAFARDPESSRQVWSSKMGYPGDPRYREFYRDLGHDGPYEHVRPWLHRDGVRRNLGIKYHRVTGDVPLHEKQLYDPAAAHDRAVHHAGDFLFKRGEQVRRLDAELGEAPAVVAPYDLELFGHWWYEGPHFLEAVFRQMADPGRRPPTRLLTPGEVLDLPGSFPRGRAGLSTWGEAGYLQVWLDESNAWVLHQQHECEQRMLEAAARHSRPGAQHRQLLDQMLRELLLLQASDWAFILKHETVVHYATKRVTDHVDRFLTLERALDDPDALTAGHRQQILEEDAIFPGLDHRAVTGGPVVRGDRLGHAPPTALDAAGSS